MINDAGEIDLRRRADHFASMALRHAAQAGNYLSAVNPK